MRLLFVAIAAGVGLSSAISAQEGKPQAVRAILERHDQSGVPDKEIVIGTATLPKGAIIGYHTHAGDEAGYIVRGTVTLKTRGQPDRILHAGDSFFNVRGSVHSMQAPDSDAVALSSWIIDKGSQLATPVP